MTKPPNPFRWFDSSPEVIRLVVMMYVKYQRVVEPLGPHLAAACAVDELGGDPHSVCGLADAARQNIPNAQLAAISASLTPGRSFRPRGPNPAQDRGRRNDSQPGPVNPMFSGGP